VLRPRVEGEQHIFDPTIACRCPRLTETDILHDPLDLPSIECQLLLADLYEKIEFAKE
jgi:hypothetical protein